MVTVSFCGFRFQAAPERLQEEPFADAEAQRVFHQAEVTEFDNLFAFVAQLIEAGRRAVDIENADIARGTVQKRRQPLVGEPQPIDPVPARADLPVEIAVIASGIFSARMIAVCRLAGTGICAFGGAVISR